VVGAGVVVTLQQYLSDRVGAWVSVIIGVIFVVCVMAFRRGVVGEVRAHFTKRRAPAVP
jgi:branched-chain amino acid transport system permease protein